jgi:hypothetical protein
MNWRDLESELCRLFASYGAELSDWGGDITITCAGDRNGRQRSVEISLTEVAQDMAVNLGSVSNE